MPQKSIAEKVAEMMDERPSLYDIPARTAAINIHNKLGKQHNLETIRTAVRDLKKKRPVQILENVTANKKVSKFNWREVTTRLQDMQDVLDDGKDTQNEIEIEIKTKEPIAIISIGDLHMGSWGTDYDLLLKITDEIKNTPNLYIILEGDLLQMSIKLRGVLEVMDNSLPPAFQMKFMESWLDEIKHKVLWSGWDNHSVMREETAVGFSTYQRIMSAKNIIFHNGIAHADVKVGNQLYKIAAAHFFRGRSIENPCHGQMRYMRREGIDREICFAADSHVPGMVKFVDGHKTRVAVNCGSTQTNSGYAKRFFSLITHPAFPCVVLNPDQHLITPYWSISEWIGKK